MSTLRLVWRPDRDHRFNVGDTCVLNSGSPVMEVVAVEANGDRAVRWDGGAAQFPSKCLRLHALMAILGGKA